MGFKINIILHEYKTIEPETKKNRESNLYDLIELCQSPQSCVIAAATTAAPIMANHPVLYVVGKSKPLPKS